MPASSTKVKELEKTKETKKKEEHKKTRQRQNSTLKEEEGRERHTHTQDRKFRAQSFKDNMGFWNNLTEDFKARNMKQKASCVKQTP